MLIFQDNQPSTRQTPPPWLVGCADVLRVEDRTGAHRWWGVGNAHLIGPRDDYLPLSDGWLVALAGDLSPQIYRRTLRWCRTTEVEDTQGRTWTAPTILNAAGERVILVSYGRDYLPVLSADQARAVEIATAARQQLLAAHDLGEAIDFSVAARWAAELLALTHHLSAEVLAVLAVLDEALILGVLSAACGLPLKRQGD